MRHTYKMKHIIKWRTPPHTHTLLGYDCNNRTKDTKYTLHEHDYYMMIFLMRYTIHYHASRSHAVFISQQDSLRLYVHNIKWTVRLPVHIFNLFLIHYRVYSL